MTHISLSPHLAGWPRRHSACSRSQAPLARKRRPVARRRPTAALPHDDGGHLRPVAWRRGDTGARRRSDRRGTAQKIGVAFGGGAAKGFAHIGVLRWFDEHRIPVDVAAGTSMGGLIGGAFAVGLSPDEVQTFAEGIDWDLVFLNDTPFKNKAWRRKEDARRFPAQIEFGLKRGLVSPTGLNSGRDVDKVIDGLTLPVRPRDRLRSAADADAAGGGGHPQSRSGGAGVRQPVRRDARHDVAARHLPAGGASATSCSWTAAR